MEYGVLKKSKKSRARLGVLKTEHGEVQTPCLVPVATQAVIKTLDSKEVEETKSQILIANTFHLHLKPDPARIAFRSEREAGGEGIIKKSGGLHKFMNWKKPLMTDSGGFQVFSLGFGKDFRTGKISGKNSKNEKTINKSRQPKSVKITQEGVFFRSPIDGKELFLGPEKSIEIQEKLGADIIFTFDECPPPNASYKYLKESLAKTHKWAKICQNAKKTKQTLYGIVQGGKFFDLRKESAKYINSLDFDGFGIGGEFGSDKKEMNKMILDTLSVLQEEKPRHLLGIGKLEDIENIIKAGVDTFDCTVPTHYARRGIGFTSEGVLDLEKTKFLKNMSKLDKKCDCVVCQSYKKNYICHLLRAKEITALKLLTFHNLYFFNTFVENIRKKIGEGRI